MPLDERPPQFASVTELARLLAPLPEFEPAGWRIREHDSRLEILDQGSGLERVARLSLALTHTSSGASRTLETELRLFANRDADRLLADTLAWREGGAAAVLPRPLGVFLNGHLYIEEVAERATLHDAVREGGIAPETVAASLATLHGAHTTFAHTRPVDGRLVEVHALLGSLRANGLLDDGAVATVAGPLTAALPVTRAFRPLHGRLRPSKIRTRGARLVFVALQDRAMGDPFDDWGSLVAHLIWESRTELPEGAVAGRFAARLTSLARASAPLRPARELAFFTACTLIETVATASRKRTLAAPDVQLALQLARQVLVEPT